MSEKGFVVWLTGLPGSGKTTIARILEQKLKERGFKVELLDGDEVRKWLSPEAGFTREDRERHLRRVIYVSKLLTRHGVVVIASFVSPYRKIREEARKILENFVEVLRDRVRKFGNVEIVWQDFLDMEMPRVTKVLSNTPYSVASRILVKLAKEGGFRRGVLVLQRELALRLLAKPGTESYGRLSVIMQLSFEIEHAGYIPRTAFYPQPKVDSLIVILKPKGRCGVEELEKVERLTAILFSQRRRKLGKVLKVKLPKLYEVLKDDRSPLLEKRVYELTPQEILLLSRIYA